MTSRSGNGFLDITPKAQATEEKDKLDFTKIKNIYASMGINTEVKRQPIKWKTRANFVSDKGIVSRIYKELLKFKKKKIQMGNLFQQTFLQRRYVNGQVHENIFNIISHYGNANQNHNEIPPLTH